MLITPPPVNTYQRAADLASRDPPLALDREFNVTRAYAKAVREVGISENVEVVDIWTALWEAAGMDERALRKYLQDGLHLNAAGYDVSPTWLCACALLRRTCNRYCMRR
jgi:lysophospholipase L1-like esterase